MVEDDQRGEAGVGLGRTLALSDGIFAIAMTLLAFQLQAPILVGRQVDHLPRALGDLGGRYFVFGLTFAVIGLLWLGHHRLFGQVARVDEALMLLNLVFLMTIAVLPFPSSVLGRYGGQPVAVVLYASNMALAGALLTALAVVADRRGLLALGASRSVLRKSLWRSGTMAAVFALSVPVALVSPSVAAYLWIAIVPLRVAGARLRRRLPSGAATPPAAIRRPAPAPSTETAPEPGRPGTGRPPPSAPA